MKVIAKRSFRRDLRQASTQPELKNALEQKILQMIAAKSIAEITGLKLLRGYSVYYRIKVKSENFDYRIGAIIRNDTIWLLRFLPRKIIYLRYP